MDKKAYQDSRVVLYFNGSFHRKLVPYEFLLVGLHTISLILSTCGAFLEVVFEFEWRSTYFGSLRAKVILAPLGMPKWVWPSMNQHRVIFVQTSTLPPSMHHKLPDHGRCCMQNNQLPTKCPFESKDISNIRHAHQLLWVASSADIDAFRTVASR